MSTSLSTLLDNLSNRIHQKHKYDSCGYILNTLEERRVVSYCLNALIVKENLLKSLMKT